MTPEKRKNLKLFLLILAFSFMLNAAAQETTGYFVIGAPYSVSASLFYITVMLLLIRKLIDP